MIIGRTAGFWHQDARADWSGTLVSSTPFTLYFYNGGIRLNGTTKKTWSALSNEYSQNALRIAPPRDTASYIRFYNCKIYRNGTLIHELIPVKINSTGKGAILDILTNTFYYNGGSGNFTLGPEK